METNRSWSIDDRRLNFQFGTEVGYEVKNGQLGRLLRNPTYTGIGPQFWSSMDMLSSETVAWGTPNCGKGQPGQVGHTGHPSAPARFRNVRVGVQGVTARPEAHLATVAVELATAASPGAEVDGRGRPPPPGADPVRQLGDPPERRRGRHHGAVAPCTTTGGRRPGRRRSSTTPTCRPSSSASLDAVRVAPARPRLARPRAHRGSPAPTAPVDPATAAASPADRAAGGAGLRRRRRRARGGRVLSGRTTGPAGSPAPPGRSSPARRPSAGCRASPATTAPTGWPATRRGRWAELDGAALGAGAAAKARASADPVELPAGRYEVVLEPTAVTDILQALAVRRLQRQGVERAALVRAAGRGPVRPGHHDRRRPARRPATATTATARPTSGSSSSTAGRASP